VPVKQSSFKQAAESVKLQLEDSRKRNRVPDEETLAQRIYSAMTRRRHADELRQIMHNYSQKHANDYAAALKKLDFTKSTRVGPLDAPVWVHVSRPLNIHQRFERLGDYEITRKEYFSLQPRARTVDGVAREAILFAKTMPKIRSRLTALSKARGVEIKMKFADDFGDLLCHPDSLVVHFSDAGLRREVRRIVEEEFAKAGVSLADRSVRAKSGFDFRSTKKRELSLSHSELVAAVIAKHAVKERRRLAALSESRLADWLMQSVKSVSAWNPRQIHAFMTAK
jgi:hypothetical protein